LAVQVFDIIVCLLIWGNATGTVRIQIQNLVLARHSKLFGALMRMESEAEIEMHKHCAKQLFFDE